MSNGALLLLGVSGTEIHSAEADLFRRLQPAGYFLAEHNLSSPAQVRKLTDSLRDLSTDEPLIAISQDGGSKSPLARIAAPGPSPAALASRGDLGKIADSGVFTADLLRLLGINLNIAPTLDPSPQGWSEDPQRVIDRAGQWNRWMRKRSIAGCARHFPGGASASNLNDLLRGGIIPYTALMPEIDAVMTANRLFPNIDPEFPAALSQRIVRSFLRDQLGFDKHLVLTENPDVERAIRAGNDLVILRNSTEDAETACARIAELPHWMIDDAQVRLDRFRKKKLHSPLKWSEEKWAAARASLEALTAEFPEGA